MFASFESIKIVLLALLGLLFFVSYFLADKNWFFEYLAYFPRKRKGAQKIGGLVFGCGFWVIAIINYLMRS
jgi:hypothetical protein